MALTTLSPVVDRFMGRRPGWKSVPSNGNAFLQDIVSHQSALTLTCMRGGLVWRLRAKSIRYPPAACRPESQSFGRLVLAHLKPITSQQALSTASPPLPP
jgi:hypothetical protein